MTVIIIYNNNNVIILVFFFPVVTQIPHKLQIIWRIQKIILGWLEFEILWSKVALEGYYVKAFAGNMLKKIDSFCLVTGHARETVPTFCDEK